MSSQISIGNLASGTLVENGAFRVEADSMGNVLVSADKLWGAQTQRALAQFSIGDDHFPASIQRAYGYIKKAAAILNSEAGKLSQERADWIVGACDELIAGTLDSHFPLHVWQAGSGTPTHMNVNEVLSNRAIQLSGGVVGTKDPVHPNDHVNMSQSTNDTFVSAMHIAAVWEICDHLIPSVEALVKSIRLKAVEWVDVVKIGRTHLQDATPLTVGQEWSGYYVQLEDAVSNIKQSVSGLYRLAIGGTAVGTGINSDRDFGAKAARMIAELTEQPFESAPNRFAAQASLDCMVRASAALRGLAVALFKVANDLRWLGCGPRAGIHEINLPETEPGSSIMPGKVNPTLQEAAIMVCIQVMGNDTAVAFAGSQGNFELNAMRPVVCRNVMHSIAILSDACDKLRAHSIDGITLDRDRIRRYLDESVMLVTALNPVIGYDNAADIAHKALEEKLPLREAAISSGLITPEEFDEYVDPSKMVGDPRADLGLERTI